MTLATPRHILNKMVILIFCFNSLHQSTWLYTDIAQSLSEAQIMKSNPPGTFDHIN